MPPIIIAHRTCPLDAPENSLTGLRVAAQLRADAVEIDLRMSLDQQPFIFHDWTMRRTTGWRLPLELTPSSVIRRLRLKGSTEPIAGLKDVLNALDPGLRLAVDVKTPWAMLPLVHAIQQRSLERRVLIWCTSALAVRFALRSARGVEVAYLKNSRTPQAKRAFLHKARDMGAQAVSAHWLAIDSAFVAEAHELGLRVYSYHGAHELTPEKLSAGLDGLITDFVRDAREAVVANAGGSIP